MSEQQSSLGTVNAVSTSSTGSPTTSNDSNNGEASHISQTIGATCLPMMPSNQMSFANYVHSRQPGKTLNLKFMNKGRYSSLTDYNWSIIVMLNYVLTYEHEDIISLYATNF